MKNRKSVFILFAILLGVTILVTPVLARPGAGTELKRMEETGANLVVPTTGELSGAYIILLDEPAVASYTGGIAGYAATSPQVTGDRKLDLESPAAEAYAAYLENQQADFIDGMNAALGRTVKVSYQYMHALNGMTVDISAEEAAVVASLPGVAMVEAEVVAYPDTDVGPQWIGADDIWNGNTSSGMSTKGEGIIAGIIDTGINSSHPSFADIGGDGYDHTNPFGSEVYVGVCDPLDPSYDPSFICNDKLIGAWSFVTEATTPEDSDGHGSHTASITAGNIFTHTKVATTGVALTATLSGVAPHANVIAYDVCSGGCTNLPAAINQAVLDGVDVINFSIGPSGGSWDPWNQSAELAFLGAYNAGVFVSESAGNAGPAPGTTSKNAPWVMNVAASTHNRAIFNNVVNMTGGDTTPPADIQGQGFTYGYGPAPIVYAGDYSSGLTATPELCGVGGLGSFVSPWPPGTFSGEIVVCDRGTYGRVEKGANVLSAGAGGYILADNGSGIVLDEHVLPGTHISQADGTVLKAWLATGSGHMATLTGINLDYSPSNGDILAGFSSRGPGLFDMVQPNVAAPGVGIWGASCMNCQSSSPDTMFQSGTSQASPHDAGAAALLMALHPNWSPSQIKSALMSTSTPWQNMLKEDGSTAADPFDVGGGRVNLTNAAYAGFVQHITGAEFLAADPGSAGKPRDLNLASLADGSCNSSCSWTRTISSTMPVTVSWTTSVDNPTDVVLSVSPSSFDLGPYATKVVTITADTSGAASGTWLFGNVNFAPATLESGVLPSNAHWSVAVMGSPLAPPDIDVSPTSLSWQLLTNSQDSDDLTISNLGDDPLNWSIFEEDTTAPVGVDWSDNFDSYASGSQLHGQGGWKGWGNDPAAGALTSTDQARSTPNSAAISNASDLVHEYSGYDSGLWVYTAYQYIPGSFSGDSYFILLNQYDDAGTTNNWSTQVHFQSATGNIINDGQGGGTMSYMTDQWVEIRVEIDLDLDTQSFFYNNNLLFTQSWSAGQSGGGITSIGAVDLFANGASAVYYDDLSLAQGAGTCAALADIPWASVSPDNGTTSGGGSDIVTVSVDTTGLSDGTYTGNLCITSDDPDESLVVIPLDLDVVSGFPDIDVSPTSLNSTQTAGSMVDKTLTINNVGGSALNWDIDEDNTVSALNARPGLASETITIGDAELTGSGLSPDAFSTGDTPLLSPAGSITLTHSSSNTVVPGSVACNYNAPPNGASDNAYLRVFDLSSYPAITGDFNVTNVQFGVESASSVGGTQPLTINLYTTASEPLLYANMSLIGTADISLPDQSLTLVNIPVTGTASPSDLLVVEIFQPDTGNTDTNFFFGSNAQPQTDESYLASVGCSLNNPTDIALIGFPDMHIVMNVSGDVGTSAACDAPSDIPWLSLSPTSGTTAAAGSDDVTVTFDSTGLSTGTYNAALCVNSNDPDEPVVEVPVQLDVLEGFTAYLPVIMNKPPTQVIPVTYENGPLVTHPGAGSGGADVSRLQNSSLSMCILGFGHAQGTDFRVADDFTVTDPSGWTIDDIVFYAYQTNSPTTSTMNFISLQIWDGEPGNGGSVIWGDTTTNVLQSTTWSNIYRDSETSQGSTARPIMASTAAVGAFLAQGTYWLDWNTGGTLGSGPWAPPITIVGNNTTGNGLQFDGSDWNPAIDQGTGCGSLTPQGFPFAISGTVGP